MKNILILALAACSAASVAIPAAAAEPSAKEAKETKSAVASGPPGDAEIETGAPTSAPSKPASGAAGEALEAPHSKVLNKDPKGCTWIESEATVAVSEEDNPHQARAKAVNQAEDEAVRDFLGVTVRSQFFNYQQEGLRDQPGLTENILSTTRLGYILKERLISGKYRETSDCATCRYYVKLRACVMPLPDDHDKDFRVDLQLSRERFVEGDKAVLKITPTKDSYVYVYDVGMDKDTSIIVPNDQVAEAQGQVHLKAGQTWVYPPESNTRASLEAQLPPGTKISAETLRVVAARTPLSKDVSTPLPIKKGDPSSGGFLNLMQRITEAKVDWTEDVKAFTIYKH